MTALVNLTPHVLRVYLGRARRPLSEINDADKWLVIPPSGRVAHMDMAGDLRSRIEGVLVMRWLVGGIDDLPEPQDDVVLIVSSVIARHVMRPDCVSPDLNRDPIYGEDGQLYAVRRFQSWQPRKES